MHGGLGILEPQCAKGLYWGKSWKTRCTVKQQVGKSIKAPWQTQTKRGKNHFN